jgi:hypothetical protein
MSIITVVFVPEGIAMAADSRLTGVKNHPNGIIDRFSISDNSQKLFLLTKTKAGISSCGDAIVDGKTIADFIRAFEIEKVDADDSVTTIADKLKLYLIEKYPNNMVSFFVAGYEGDFPFVFSLSKDVFVRSNLTPSGEINYGATWNGEYEAIEKLLNGTRHTELNFPLMPLKDAIDFAEFVVEVIIKYQRFEDRVATCGGPIDILVITKDRAQFVRHKIYKP